LTVGFGIAPNLLTLFPTNFQEGFQEKKALAGLGLSTLTAGGEFHPALRTLTARYERPAGIMAKRGCAIKNLRYGECISPLPKRFCRLIGSWSGVPGQGESIVI
jgi:hypothetical protein